MAKIKVKLKLSKGLKKHDKVNDLIAQCVAGVKAINGYEQKKQNPSVTLSVMKAVRDGCKVIDGDVDKNSVVSIILQQVYELNDDELLVLHNQIIDIIENGDLDKGFFLKVLKFALKHGKRFIGL